jgi:DNA-binding SARP family transcriptional activator
LSTLGSTAGQVAPTLCVLGGVRIECDGEGVELRGQVRRLLGILLAEHDRPVDTEVLIDRLWPEDTAPRTARKAVQVLTGRLRRALEAAGIADRLDTTEHGYLLRGAPADLAGYEATLSAAEARAGTDARASLDALDAAFEQWARPWGAQGDETWLAARVAAIEERHRRAEELWADLALEAGRAARAVDRLRDAAEREPFRERRWAHLMLATYRDGRQVDALRVYDEAATVLRELGLDPGPELQRLRIAILEHDVALQARRPAAADVFGATSFVGRDRELALIDTLLESHRLLTVVGIGGIGKTRLVDEYARGRQFGGDDVRSAGFASTPPGVGAAVHLASELGLGVDAQTDREAADVLAATVGREPVLLVLDALEHAPDANSLVLGIIERCPRVRVLATSRVPLGVQAERTLSIAPLPLGTSAASEAGTALELLADRAGIGLDALDQDARADLIARVEATGGIPLLVELAAPSVHQPNRDDGVDDAADDTTVVTGDDQRDAIRDAIVQALDAVDERACELAVDAAVLPAGVSERTAAALRGLPRDVARRALRQLTWVNLMATRPGLAGIRYQSLDPVREALGPTATAPLQLAIERASQAVQQVFEAFAPSPVQPRVASMVDAAEDEHANLRFLLAHQLAVYPQRALELAIAASDFWASRGFSVEGRGWIEAATAAARPKGVLAWDSMLALVRTTRTFAEISLLRDRLEASVASMRSADADWAHLGVGLMYLAISRGWSGDADGAVAALDEVDPLVERSGTEWSRVMFGRLRGLQLVVGGDLAGGRATQRAALGQLIELGDPYSAAQTVYLSAVIGDMAGADDVLDDIRIARELATTVKDVSMLGQLLLLEARSMRRAGDGHSPELFAEAAERLLGFGGVRAASLAYRDLGLLEVADGATAAAGEHLRRSLVPLLQLDRPAAALAVGGLAVLAHRAGDGPGAARLLAEAGALHAAAASIWQDESRRLAELAESIGLPLTGDVAAAGGDDRLLELVGMG